jgi:hypothetical protein
MTPYARVRENVPGVAGGPAQKSGPAAQHIGISNGALYFIYIITFLLVT